MSRNGEEVFNFKLAGNSQSVFYAFKPRLVEAAAPTAFGFVPADDSSAANSYVTGKEIFVNNIAVSSDNETVVYIAGDFAFSQLYSLTFQNGVPIERQLSVAAADQPAFYAITDFKIAASGGRVVFRAGQNGSSPLDLYSAAILDNAVAVKLNTVPTEDTEDGLFKGVGLYFPLPNSPRVVFTYIPDFGKANIYSNAVTGGVPVILAANANDFFSDAVQLTADGRRVVYKKTITDEFGNSTVSLWAVNVPQ